MEYLLLIYHDEERWANRPEEERRAIVAEYFALTSELREKGRYVGGERLDASSTAATVRVRDGEQVVTDGPFTETKEQLGGFFRIEADSLEEELEWAAKIPAARYGSIEVRPVVPVPAEVRAG